MKKGNLFWVGLALGLWVFLSPWILGFYGLDLPRWSNVFAGAGVFFIFLWERYGEEK